MWNYISSDEVMRREDLVHHGILGMHWGVRRTDAQLAKLAGRSIAQTLQNKRIAKEDSPESTHSAYSKARRVVDDKSAEQYEKEYTPKRLGSMVTDKERRKIQAMVDKGDTARAAGNHKACHVAQAALAASSARVRKAKKMGNKEYEAASKAHYSKCMEYSRAILGKNANERSITGLGEQFYYQWR